MLALVALALLSVLPSCRIDLELRRFPPLSVIGPRLELIDSCAAHRAKYERWADNTMKNRKREVFLEAERIQTIYISYVLATNDDISLSMRLEYLRDLRRLLGEPAYLAGQLPPPLPYGYFESLN